MIGFKPVEWVGKSLVEIYEAAELNKTEQAYVSMILRGMSKEEAKVYANIRWGTRGGEYNSLDGKAALFRWLVANRERYEEEALNCFIGGLRVKAQELIAQLLEKGLSKWDELDRYDKNCVMQAVGLVAKRAGGSEKQLSYEEELMQRKRLIEGKAKEG